MSVCITDDECCQFLINAFARIFPNLIIKGGAEEPFYTAQRENNIATIHFRSNYPRSLLHEVSHYRLAGDQRRKVDDFGYWYSPCGRSLEEQRNFELVEARPQGLEKVMCEIVEVEFSPSLDDFSGSPPSESFLLNLELAYQEMLENPPPSVQKALCGLTNYRDSNN